MDGSRVALSCGSCRQRKLKCDRDDPCSNCISRSVDCVYASYPRGRGASSQRRDGSNHQLNARIRRLEQLVSAMASNAPQPSGDSAISYAASSHDGSRGSPGEVPTTVGLNSQGEPYEIKPGRIQSNNGQMTYVSGTHWSALCNEMAEIREHLDRINLDESVEGSDPQSDSGPMLLEGLQMTSSLQEIMADIPPKDVCDRLVSRYFNSNELAIVILHGPSFEQEYQRFWLNPQDTMTSWIGLLFGVLASGAFLLIRSGEELPPPLGNPKEVLEGFQRRSTECLIITKYSSAPGPYTMESLLLNLQTEFVRRKDADVGVWILGGVAIRLAFRMGYHRDPSHHPQLTTFQGEMRRRIWAVISQLDALTSCTIGLPPMVQEAHSDTQLPRNLMDEDFGPETIELRPSRPETELTPILYTITKSRIFSIFRTIFNYISLGRIESYDKVLALDRDLQEHQNSISPRFRLAALEDAVTTPAYLFIRRYSLALLFLKSRCLLHRHYMAKSYTEPKYSFSRMVAMDSAMMILTHQATILKQLQPGGILFRHRFFVSSIELQDFLLATMIVCLEISSREQLPQSAGATHDQITAKYSRHELIDALHGSVRYLEEMRETSTEARKASSVISLMIRRFTDSGMSQEIPCSASNSTGEYSSSSVDITIQTVPPSAVLGSTGFSGSHLSSESIPTSHPAFSSTLEGMSSFFNTPDIVDWDQWEAFIQNSRHIE